MTAELPARCRMPWMVFCSNDVANGGASVADVAYPLNRRHWKGDGPISWIDLQRAVDRCASRSRTATSMAI